MHMHKCVKLKIYTEICLVVFQKIRNMTKKSILIFFVFTYILFSLPKSYFNLMHNFSPSADLYVQ